MLIKRFFDFFCSIISILILLPFLTILAILVRKCLGSPIIFKQKRPGKNGVPFMLYKFRTMKEDKDNNGDLLPDDKRLTGVGKLLRSTSIDELPEFWNVLKGDMSLVGPRPLRMQYLDRYTPEQARRHDVRPGITGWAQVNGRNAITWEEKFKLDVWYVDNQSFLLDLKILIITIFRVLKQEGINQAKHVTMRKFNGNN